MDGEKAALIPEAEVHKDSVPVEKSSDDARAHGASESAKDHVVEDNSSNSETHGNQNQTDKPVNRNLQVSDHSPGLQLITFLTQRIHVKLTEPKHAPRQIQKERS